MSDYKFIKGQFTEAELEKAIIELFQAENYEYTNGNNLDRKFDEILLKDDLKDFLHKRYANENLSETETAKIINRLEHINSAPLYIGNRDAFRLINDGFDLQRDNVKSVALHVDYIDFDEPENNKFRVINQYSVQGGRLRRPDLLVFINGIPIAIFEFKSAINEETNIYDAWEQICIRYCRDIPNLMKYAFLSVINDGANTKMGSIFTPYAYYYSWNKANEHDKVANGISSLFTMIKGAFAKDRLIAILRDFIFYPDDSHKDEAIVCRYPQFFAATKMLANIKEHLRPAGDGKGGTYFGATGCGKTYTMLFLSRLMALRDNALFKNPTIIIITDREDLDTQTSKLFVTAKKYLHDDNVRSIENREDMKKTLKNRKSGGVYIITIQKFCEKIGLLSERNNIICISDEAHRSQTGVGAKLKKTDKGVFTTYGFAYYLRNSFPNATYVGFTGTPIDETIAVFGSVVDSYTMKESSDDGITVRIAYEPRLARVIVSDEQAKEIEKYYESCADQGSTFEQIEESKKAMSKMSAILGHPDRLKKLANDIVEHYEALCAEKPGIVQKAMIVCADRKIAFEVLKLIKDIRPEWGEARKADNEAELTNDRLDKLLALPKINLVATQGTNDEKELFEACGTKEYRKTLDENFKNNDSNFKIAIVVDMWITGFDVPSLAVMYIDKPLQKHTLIQTISRVNRVFEGKDKGLVVDYIGIKNDMLEAVKKYGSTDDNPVDELPISLSIFRNYLAMLDELMANFDASIFFVGSPLQRLNCLNAAAEFAQTSKETQTRFMGLSKRLKAAYMICYPSGELSKREISKAQFYLAIRSIIYKQTKGDAPDAEVMNKVVENMVREALACTGIENIVGNNKAIDMFSDEFIKEVDAVKLPITKFNALLKMARKAITEYGHINKGRAVDFDERLKKVVEEYNNRDNLAFTSEVVADFVNDLSDQLMNIMKDIQTDIAGGEKIEGKVFFDILVKVRDTHKFQYEDEKCKVLAKKIKELVEDKSQYIDWSIKSNIKSQLERDLTVLLYRNGYPPEWNEEVFNRVLEQAENFKKYNT